MNTLYNLVKGATNTTRNTRSHVITTSAYDHVIMDYLVCPVVIGLVCYYNLNASGKIGESGVGVHELSAQYRANSSIA